jgi:hypothetical protein
MTFDQKIKLLADRGYKFHVFQTYGETGDERGHSRSFDDFDRALRYARLVPRGIIYDNRGTDVTGDVWPLS